MAWIKLTHHGADNPKEIKDVYVNVEQIVMVRDSLSAAQGYPTTVTCTNGTQDVRETKTDVMALIANPNVNMPAGA